MSFRQRLMLFTATAITLTVAGAAIAVWFVAKHELYDQLDQTLVTQAASPGGGFVNPKFTYNFHCSGVRPDFTFSDSASTRTIPTTSSG